MQAQLSPDVLKSKEVKVNDEENGPGETQTVRKESLDERKIYSGLADAETLLKGIDWNQSNNFKVVESEEELQLLSQSLLDGEGKKAILMQGYEHQLRSYKPIFCWLFVSVISQ